MNVERGSGGFNLLEVVSKRVADPFGQRRGLSPASEAALPIEDPAMRGSVGDTKGGDLQKENFIIRNSLFDLPAHACL